jgi:tRNA threonylcarbamoyladenosine biosynthesis protein TsaB
VARKPRPPRPRPAPRIQAQHDQPLVLLLDTSSAVEALALVQGELTIARQQLRRAKGRGSPLAQRIQGLLASVDRVPGDLAAVAVGIGPGAFTGVRVGIAVATGLATGLGVPLVGFDSLTPWAHAFGGVGLVSVATDARRNEVYCATWRATGGALQPVLPLQLVGPGEWLAGLAALGETMALLGDGARLYADQARSELGERAVVAGTCPSGPDLGAIGAGIARRLQADEPPGPSARPLYLREHDGTRVPLAGPEPS